MEDKMDVDAAAGAGPAAATVSKTASSPLFNYVVSAQQPTAVTHAVVGNFTGPADVNLLLGKSTHIEVVTLTPEGLQNVLDIPVYGRITVMRLYRPQASQTHLLFVMTEQCRFFVLAYDAATGTPVTQASGDASDAIGRPVDSGQLGLVDPECRAAALHLYDGLLKVVPMDPSTGALGAEAFSARLEELSVVDACFLAGCAQPTVALLYEDAKHARHLKTYAVSLRHKELEEGPLSHQNLDAGAAMVIPVPKPLGGAIVVGESVVTYFSVASPQYQRSAALSPQTIVRACCQVDEDGSRFLLGDYLGGLHLLVLACVDGSVAGLKLQRLGTTSAASALCYLDSGAVYVGSRSGDHQLIRLHSEPVSGGGGGGGGGGGAAAAGGADGDTAMATGGEDGPGAAGAGGSGGGEDGAAAPAAAAAAPPPPAPSSSSSPPSYVEVLDTFTSLAPILDFSVQDMDRAGQGQLVMCCGTLRDGSLRIVRNGVGLSELSTVELAGVRGVWALRPSWAHEHDRTLVVTFVGETRVLALDEDDELGEVEPPGFDAARQTLLCANTRHDTVLQVTAASARLIDASGATVIAEWRPEEGQGEGGAGGGRGGTINLAASSPTQLLLSTGGGSLTLLDIGPAGFTLAGTATLPAEVACLDITPVGGGGSGGGGGGSSGGDAATLAAVGTWGMEVVLLRLPDLSRVACAPLGAEGVIPRSALLASFEGGAQHHLLVGLGDGALHSWRLNPATGELSDKKQIQLGTKPISLRAFTNGGVSYAFAACDRPTVVHSQNRKLVCSNLNEGEVACMAPFSSAGFPDSLAIAREDSLTIGAIDAVQKLHVRTVPLGEQPRRLALQEATRTVAVATAGLLGGMSPSGAPQDRGQVIVFDDVGFDRLASHQLAPQELACSLASVSFSGDPTPYYALGTAVVRPDEYEPSKGRLTLLAYRGAPGRLEVVESREVKGAVYALQPFQGKLLAAVNSKVHVFRWVPAGGGGGGGGGAGGSAAAAAGAGGAGGGAGGGGGGGGELVSETSTPVQVLSLFLAARGDQVLVGDLMKSLTLLVYKAAEGSLEARARDLDSKWLTALAALDDDTFALADNTHNLVVLRSNADAASDEERSRLQTVGCFHAGAFINAMRPGSLVMRLPDSELASVPTLLFGGVEGSIGVMASLPPDLFALLDRLQSAMQKVVRGVGGLTHAAWRAFHDDRRSEDARNFIDGDLIESFLDLAPEQAAAVVASMGTAAGGGGAQQQQQQYSVEDITRRVEELQRLH